MRQATLTLIQATALLYGGWWLVSFERWSVIGYLLMGLGLAALIKALYAFLVFSFQSKHQIDLLYESRILSHAHGHAYLANEGSPFIKTMARSRRGFYLGSLGPAPLFYDPFQSGNGHMLTYAPSRTGKTVSVIIPALLHWFGGSVFVTDVKGELAAITADYRKAMGQKVILFNPFNVLGLGGQCFNPLRILVDDVMQNAGANIHELARAISFQLIAERANDMGDGIFFRNGARRLIIAFLLYMAVFEPNACTLPKLRKHIFSTHDQKIAVAQKLKETSWFSGLLEDYGHALEDMLNPDYAKTFGAFRDNAMSALEIYDAHSALGKAMSRSDFSLESVLDEKTTLYLILPESKLETHGPALGLIATLLLETIAAMSKAARIMMLLEEMGNLGRLPNLSKALSLLPGKGVRCWMVFQSRRQPVEIYGPQMASLIEDQSSMIQSWSIRSESDRKAWSARCGQKTLKARSLSRDPGNAQTPWRLNIHERAHPVLSPDEIARMDQDHQLIALDGKPVIRAQKLAYFQILPWRNHAAPSPYHGATYPKDKAVRHDLHKVRRS